MRLHIPRQQSGGCVAGKSFYRCAQGPFSGCCSSDPCDTGVCGDDNESSTASTKNLNQPSTENSASLPTATPPTSLPSTKSTSARTTGGSNKSLSTSASPSTTSALSATSTSLPSLSPSAPVSSALQRNTSNRPPVGAIIGAVLGGLALLALLAALLWLCLQRKPRLKMKTRRSEKKDDKKRENELLEAETAILEREKFLNAGKMKAETQNQRGYALSEFGGYYGNNKAAGKAGHRYYRPHKRRTSSNSTPLYTQMPLPVITTPTPALAATPLIVQQSSMPLSSISEKENVDSIPILDGNEPTFGELPVDIDQQVIVQTPTPSFQALPRIDPLAPPSGRWIIPSARISRAPSTDFTSISSGTNSYANTVSSASLAQPRDFVAHDGVVMRSNLNVSWNRRPRQGSVRKHVMSFMEYDTENDSVCSSSRRSSLRVAGKPNLPGDQGRGAEHLDLSLRR